MFAKWFPHAAKVRRKRKDDNWYDHDIHIILPIQLPAFSYLRCSTYSLEPSAAATDLIQVEKAEFHVGAKSQYHRELFPRSTNDELESWMCSVALLSQCVMVLSLHEDGNSFGAAITAQLRNKTQHQAQQASTVRCCAVLVKSKSSALCRGICTDLGFASKHIPWQFDCPYGRNMHRKRSWKIHLSQNKVLRQRKSKQCNWPTRFHLGQGNFRSSNDGQFLRNCGVLCNDLPQAISGDGLSLTKFFCNSIQAILVSALEMEQKIRKGTTCVRHAIYRDRQILKGY